MVVSGIPSNGQNCGWCYDHDVKLIAGLWALLLPCLSAEQIVPIDPQWVLVSDPLRWTTPPPEIENRTHTASGSIIVLYPSGTFGEVWCTL